MKKIFIALACSLAGFVVLIIVGGVLFLTKPSAEVIPAEQALAGWKIGVFLIGTVVWSIMQTLGLLIGTGMYEFPQKTNEKENA